MGALSTCQTACCGGHLLVFLILLCVSIAPYWVTYVQSTHFSDTRSNLGLMFTCEERTVRFHYQYYCRILQWDDYGGEMPGWLNLMRTMVGVSLYLTLLTLIVDIKSCCFKTSARFVAQGMLLLHAGALMAGSVAIFISNRESLNTAFQEAFGKAHYESQRIEWVFHLACAGSVLATLLGFLSFFARRPEERLIRKGKSYPTYHSMT